MKISEDEMENLSPFDHAVFLRCISADSAANFSSLNPSVGPAESKIAVLQIQADAKRSTGGSR